MKRPPLTDSLVESSAHSSQKSSNPCRHRFDDDLFLPPPKVASEKILPEAAYLRYFWVFFLSLFLLLSRLVDLQIVHGEKNLADSEGNRIRRERIRPARGLIFSKDGQVLARNLPTFSVLLTPGLCPKESCDLQALAGLAGFLKMREKYESQSASPTPIVLASGLTRDEVLKLGDLAAWSYLQIESDQVRSYPDGERLAHVLGYLGEATKEELSRRPDLYLGDRIGQDGVERVYDADLQGLSGWKLYEVDSGGRAVRFLSQKDPVSGKSLTLTIDQKIQLAAFESLVAAIQKSGVCCGAVVVQDVRNGEVLALVSYPSFDLNLFSRRIAEAGFGQLVSDPRRPFFSRAVSGAFPPGSIFKIVVAAGALSEKLITTDTRILAPGSISIGSFVYGDWKPEGHGWVNVESAIAESADTFFYQIGGGYEGVSGLGPSRIAKFAALFGFGQKSQIALPEETSGLVPDPAWKRRAKGENWYLGNTYHLSIGQGDLLATPLQVNQMTAAVANGGVLFRPSVLKKITDDRGQTVSAIQGNLLREKFIEGDVLKIVRDGMRRAAEPGGTAYPFFGFKVPVGAKTGTAEVAGEGDPHAWFTAFAPFESPEVAVTVLVENGGQGADVAAPVAKKILEEYFGNR